jgi:hypothetical protein
MVLFRLCCLHRRAFTVNSTFSGNVYRRLTQRDCCRNADRDYARGLTESDYQLVLYVPFDTRWCSDVFSFDASWGDENYIFRPIRREIHADIRSSLQDNSFTIEEDVNNTFTVTPTMSVVGNEYFLQYSGSSYSVITLLYAMEGGRCERLTASKCFWIPTAGWRFFACL